MGLDIYEMAIRLLVALAAGALIGDERSYHGRPAGFPHHSLACMGSRPLMLVTVYEAHWVRVTVQAVSIDPTRMAQGIMTGIGFLGAGVIIKEGLSVRGLTTAASIWITSAIGILAGIGFYFPMAVSVVLTLGVLSFFRWIERRMPAHAYYYFAIRLGPGAAMTEAELRQLVQAHGFSMANFSYRLDDPDRVRRHSMVLRSADRASAGRLAATL